ncbi:MAG: hypothetical protein QXR96_02490, partial [Candidatus Woesearchaeota archaeon]
NNSIEINKELNELDLFVINLIKIIEKYTKYVLISGYVSIFFGRARSTEDVDMFIEKLAYQNFKKMFNELKSNGYELTEDEPESLYKDYLLDGLSINVWQKDFALLRMEIKIAKTRTQKEQLENPLIVILNEKYKLFFSQIESQIAYKRTIAKSEKDLKDARHLEIVFDNLDKNKIEKYSKLFLEEFNKKV